jgi:hypothetical protein
VVAGTPIEACPPVPDDQLDLIINELHNCVVIHMEKLKLVFEKAGSVPQVCHVFFFSPNPNSLSSLAHSVCA